MTTLSDLLSSSRKAKRISFDKAARDLLIKKETLEALESTKWQDLPEPAFVKGFLKNYAEYLKLDTSHVLALYRREFDETKYPKKTSVFQKRKTLMLTPTRIINLIFVLVVVIFIGYLIAQYTSTLSAPKLKITSPASDITTSIPVVEISGITEKGATVAIEGEFVPVDPEGNFSYQYQLQDGQNIIEVIASKRLSPKSKETLTIRLTR